MPSDSLIYLASPYSHTDPAVKEKRFRIITRVALRLICEGHLVFSPIVHCHPIAMAGSLPTDWKFWKRYCIAQVSACSEVWVVRMPGWEQSVGVQAEIDLAKLLNKPIRYIDPTIEELEEIIGHYHKAG